MGVNFIIFDNYHKKKSIDWKLMIWQLCSYKWYSSKLHLFFH